MKVLILVALVSLAVAAPLEESSDLFRSRMELMRKFESGKNQGSHSGQAFMRESPKMGNNVHMRSEFSSNSFMRESPKMGEQGHPMGERVQFNAQGLIRKEMGNEASRMSHQRTHFNPQMMRENPEMMANQASNMRASFNPTGTMRQSFETPNGSHRMSATPQFNAHHKNEFQMVSNSYSQQPIVPFSPYVMDDCVPIIPAHHPFNSPLTFFF